ncbi:hypothetical protein RUM44_003848 [Polyplax serrata]|uniref:Protein kinase C-binding protein 1 n=1 Tax=Polyplax serrata TaxID=468196 RepID=A0ABR1B156_POLSC
MSSNGVLKAENDRRMTGSSTDNSRTKKTLKSLVIPDSDPLKIKLKISKRHIEEPSGNGRETPVEYKRVKYQSFSLTKLDVQNGEDSLKEDTAIPEGVGLKLNKVTEPKMKLRSKREEEYDLDEEGTEDILKRKDILNEKEKYKKSRKSSRGIDDESPEKMDERRRCRRNEDVSAIEKSMEPIDDPKNVKKESFCWTCHKDGSVIKCDTCPRVFHLKCVSLTKDPSKNWICPECSLILHAEKMSTRSEAMKSLSLDQLCTLLDFAIHRMKNVPESQAFWKPVDPKEVPLYDKYITNPMDLNLLEKNMKAKMYGSPQAFLADTKWLLHNSIIFNSNQSSLTSTARFLVKICRQEMAEIENCPDCYLNAHTKDKWFTEVCRKPHILIWARLKGFPFWPAKAMSTNLKTQQVDARFFGAHDKAWVPIKECYLYSKNSPQVVTKKRGDLDNAFLETEEYIKSIRQKFGIFCFAPDKTPFVPEMYDKQLQSLIPNYIEEKVKKKRRGEQNENTNDKPGEKPVLRDGKKIVQNEVTPRFKLKRIVTKGTAKSDSDICLMNDEYVSEEKVSEVRVSPEDEIARKLEMSDTHKKTDRVIVDENSTDLDEDRSLPIPEHGYSLRVNNSETPEEPKDLNSENNEEPVMPEVNNKEKNSEECDLVQQTNENCEVKCPELECTAGSSDAPLSSPKQSPELVAVPKTSSEQCEVSSTSADLRAVENEYADNTVDEILLDSSTAENHSDKTKPNCQETNITANQSLSDGPKKDEDRSLKSFVNLTCDQQEKILNEAKLLANIDEMTAIGKQKILNQLGLDASNVDIRQLAQENRQILETLNKKRQNQAQVQGQSQCKEIEEVTIKSEEYEQYLIEENHEENNFDDIQHPESPKPGSIKVRDFDSLTKEKDLPVVRGKGVTEPILKIMDVQSLKSLQQAPGESKNAKMRKPLDDSAQNNKLNLEPTVKLIKLDMYNNKSVEKLNRKLKLSDEVSLMMVGGEKNVDMSSTKSESKKLSKKLMKTRTRKSLPNRAIDPGRTNTKNISVISVDTENSVTQKSLLKSLRLEEKKTDETGVKTVLITTGEKGIKNVDVKSVCEPPSKKHVNEVTIEAVNDVGKQGTGESSREANVIPPKNVTVVANSPAQLIMTNQGTQPNLALAQNNLGQLSLVHLSNLTSGIQTNFVNLTNETIGFNNSIGTLYASPGFNAEFPASSATGSVILTPSLTASLPATVAGTTNTGTKAGKVGAEPVKVPLNRIGSGKQAPGISVKSPATLGLISSQSSKLPPLIAIPGDGVPLMGEVGSVTAELNKHSIKMAEYMRATIEDILRELSSQGSLEAKFKLLSLEMEKLQWRHQQEIMELKHHSERSLMELRSTLESEKQKCLGELKAQLESQHQKIISETKRKQWCANCGKEALFYCCWNTSYCDYPCQQQHWPGHMSTCAQLGNSVSLGTTSASNNKASVNMRNPNSMPLMSNTGGYGVNGGNSVSRKEGHYSANRYL